MEDHATMLSTKKYVQAQLGKHLIGHVEPNVQLINLDKV